MMYTSTITSASLRLRESRIVAGLLLRGVSASEWQQAIFVQNVLQMSSQESTKKCSRLLRARIEPMGERLWEMVCQGERLLATQAVLAGAIKNSRLLGDFMDIVLREQRTLFAKKLERRFWNDYIMGCHGRDPDMPYWGDATAARLRSAVFCILAEAGYLSDTRALLLQNVFVDKQLVVYLQEKVETYVLRCMSVME